jgi:hypothetical protein
VTEKVLLARVGASRRAVASAGKRGSVALPLPDRFVKEEPETLVWFGRLEGGDDAVFKAYLHRGALTRWRAPLIRYRVEREYEALCALGAAGVPSSEPLFWGLGDSPVHGRFEVLVVRRIPGAQAVRDRVREGGAPEAPALFAPLFRHVRQMHRAGVHHGALSWKNVLVTDSGGGSWRFHIVDLAKALRFGRDIFGTRMARYDLLRLTSHLRDAFSSERCLAWLEEYGLAPADALRVVGDLAGYPPPRLLHQRLRLEFGLRSILSRRS